MAKNSARKLDVQLLSVAEVAAILGVSQNTARDTICKIGAIRVGARPLIKVEAKALERWIAGGGAAHQARQESDEHVETLTRPITGSGSRPKYLRRKASPSRFAPIKPGTRAKLED